jgi:alpha-L-fucosidase
LATDHPEAQWFPGAGLGLFIHWGPYSVAGIEASWPLMPHSSQHMSEGEYRALATRFRPERYDPEEWARLAKEAGCRYAVLTTKHHDGYCLFDTAAKDYSAPNTAAGRDLVGPYVEAFRAAGIKVGLYFSLIDWDDPDFATIPIRDYIASPRPFEYDPVRWDRFMARAYEQVRELLTNYGRIDLVWFDVAGFGADRWHSHELKTMMLNLQPHLVVNDRLPEAGDYATPEQYVPFEATGEWWETCMTMNDQWGYHPDPAAYKSSRRLVRTISEVVGKGGNLLLNVGPQPDGRFPPEAVERLRAIGDWMDHSGDSIHEAAAGPHPGHFYGPMTRKSGTLYLHVLDLPSEGIEVRGLETPVMNARLLDTGEPLNVSQAGARVHIDLTAEQCDPYDTVVALELEDASADE